MSTVSPTIIRTNDWCIRRFRADDVTVLRQAIHDPTIARFIGPLPYPYTLRHARQWIALCQLRYRQSAGNHQHYAITINDRVVGGIGADRDGDQAEFGYWLARPLWGRGIMTAVVRKFVPYLFRTWPIARVVAKTLLLNPASGRVLEKNHFTMTAIEIHSFRRGRRWLDTQVYTRHRRLGR